MLKILAIILIVGGFMLTLKPNLISSCPEQLTGYEMIEKRVKWGFFIGLGVFFYFNQQWDNWGLIILAFLSALTFGVIIARLSGFILDGLFAKQTLWLVIELLICIIFNFLYCRLKIQ